MDVLTALADHLTGMSFENLLLCGLDHLIELQREDFRDWFIRLRGKYIGTYRLTVFLSVHARPAESVWPELCPHLSEIEAMYRVTLHRREGQDLINLDRWSGRTYESLNVPVQLVARFREKFNSPWD
jgi:hypothetical protein